MNLVIDQGNTLFKVGLFNDNELISTSKFDYTQQFEFQNWINSFDVKKLNIIVSSVVKKEINLSKLDSNKIISINKNTSTPILNLYQTPQTLGNDRLANVVAARVLNPNKNSLVIDLGTCIKYDLINKKGEYLGGNISPGLILSINKIVYWL